MRQRTETGLSDIQGCIFEARRRRLKEMRREVGIVGEETKVWMEMSKWRLLVEPNFKTNLEMGIKKNLINWVPRDHQRADTIRQVGKCTVLPPVSPHLFHITYSVITLGSTCTGIAQIS